MAEPRVSICTVTGSPLRPMAGSIGSWLDVGLEVLLLLPAADVEPLAEIALPVEQSDADERNVQVRRALDVIAGEHAEAAGIDRHRLVQAELGREIATGRGRSTPACVAPHVAVGREVFALTAIGVVDPAVQRELAGAADGARRAASPTAAKSDCA